MGFPADPEHSRSNSKAGCANVSGFSLHANVGIPAKARHQLENLCRYVARPAVATERLSLLPDGRVSYRLRHKWHDGTTHVLFEPLELVEKLAALVPPPRFNLVRYSGIFAPAALWRSQVVPFDQEVRGSDSAAGLVADLLGRLRLRAFDPKSESGLFDVHLAAESMAAWHDYRDQVLGSGS
jgi:hypothetical protein